MKKFKKELVEFIEKATCSYTSIEEIKKLLISPRIDNLTSVFSGLMSFIEEESFSIKVFCSFNNEEIGSLTEEGADSNFLLDILKRITAYLDIDIASSSS